MGAIKSMYHKLNSLFLPLNLLFPTILILVNNTPLFSHLNQKAVSQLRFCSLLKSQSPSPEKSIHLPSSLPLSSVSENVSLLCRFSSPSSLLWAKAVVACLVDLTISRPQPSNTISTSKPE